MRKYKILLVEDDHVQNMATQDILEDLGYEVNSVYSGDAAIEAINGLEYITALVTDVDLGAGPDGFDVARYARRLHRHLPVVYVSGRMGLHHAAQGVCGSVLVAKPFQPIEVATALDQVIRLAAA